MKTIILSIVLWSVAATTSWGQVRVLGGNSGAGLRFEDLKRNDNESLVKRRFQPVALPDLFSVDERWSKGRTGEFAGTLAVKRPTAYKVGDWGCVTRPFRVLDVVSKTECLALLKFRNARPMLIRGLDTSQASVGKEFVLQHPVVIQGTYDYAAGDGAAGKGATQSALVLDRARFDSFVAEMQPKDAAQQTSANAASVRDWSDTKGNVLVAQAEFIEFKDNRVHLKRKDGGKAVDLGMTQLSRGDRRWIRNELKRRRPKE